MSASSSFSANGNKTMKLVKENQPGAENPPQFKLDTKSNPEVIL